MTCLACRQPLDGPRPANARARAWYVCPACGETAPGTRPPAFPPATPGDRTLFLDEPEGLSGIAVTVNRRERRAQIIAWDSHFIRRVVWTGPLSAITLLDLVDEK